MTDDLIAEALPCNCHCVEGFLNHLPLCPARHRADIRKAFSQANADLLAENARLREIEKAAQRLADELKRHKRLLDVPAGYHVRLAAGKLRSVLPEQEKANVE